MTAKNAKKTSKVSAAPLTVVAMGQEIVSEFPVTIIPNDVMAMLTVDGDVGENLMPEALPPVESALPAPFAFTPADFKFSPDMQAYDALALMAEAKDKRFANAIAEDNTHAPLVFVRAKEAKSSSGKHQIPCNYRTEGNNPLMPSQKLFDESANPYPCNKDIVAQVKVSSASYTHYKDVVFVAHEVFKYLVNNDCDQGINTDQLYNDTDVISLAAGHKGKDISKREQTNGNHIYYGILDTLRDLENCGMVYAIGNPDKTSGALKDATKGNRYYYTNFRIQPQYLTMAQAIAQKALDAQVEA